MTHLLDTRKHFLITATIFLAALSLIVSLLAETAGGTYLRATTAYKASQGSVDLTKAGSAIVTAGSNPTASSAPSDVTDPDPTGPTGTQTLTPPANPEPSTSSSTSSSSTASSTPVPPVTCTNCPINYTPAEMAAWCSGSHCLPQCPPCRFESIGSKSASLMCPMIACESIE